MTTRYTLEWSPAASKEFRKLDKDTQRRIDNYLRTHVDGSVNPRSVGKGLSENRVGYWRYRIGNYRVICKIKDDICVVLAIGVGHQNKVYS
ncbi:MAG: type II toxin-antitoxin system RelE/ParE family toxin [Clostridiales Family XIII bacterium]|jgi:mRNA interferase RelE/StbE|nr:type II toxin-antitoxin system RelE/ParE family toxin [Clostridiales Family XIII bacterium]